MKYNRMEIQVLFQREWEIQIKFIKSPDTESEGLKELLCVFKLLFKKEFKRRWILSEPQILATVKFKEVLEIYLNNFVLQVLTMANQIDL